MHRRSAGRVFSGACRIAPRWAITCAARGGRTGSKKAKPGPSIGARARARIRARSVTGASFLTRRVQVGLGQGLVVEAEGHMQLPELKLPPQDEPGPQDRHLHLKLRGERVVVLRVDQSVIQVDFDVALVA